MLETFLAACDKQQIVLGRESPGKGGADSAGCTRDRDKSSRQKEPLFRFARRKRERRYAPFVCVQSSCGKLAGILVATLLTVLAHLLMHLIIGLFLIVVQDCTDFGVGILADGAELRPAILRGE